MTLEERLEIWIVARCHEKNPQRQRVAELNAIFRLIYTDRRFWRYRNDGNRDYYEDALSLMWRYFFLNLCEATTARKSSSGSNLFLRIYFFKWMVESSSYSLMRYAFSKMFSPLSFLETRTYAVGRLLTDLKGHLKNIEKRMQEDISLQEPPRINNDGDVTDPVDAVPNPEPELAARQFEAFLNLLETDPKGKLNDNKYTLRGTTSKTKKPYALTAQAYLLMRHRDGMKIDEIFKELGIPEGSLKGGGKPKKWKVLAREYVQMAIDSVSE